MVARALSSLVLILLLALSTGCGFIDYFFVEPPEDTALELYEAGQDSMADKEYGNAIEYFTKLKDRYPFSPYTPQAELALGDAHFLKENYREAADTYKEFEALHPRHEEIPYVLFQIGISDFRQFSSVDRPQQTVSEALEYFRRLIELYPSTKYAAEARNYIMKCRKILADREVYVADFYWRSERYGPAWHRYAYVVKNFQDLPKVVEYAERMSKLSYFEYQKEITEEERERIVGTWKEWFDWL